MRWETAGKLETQSASPSVLSPGSKDRRTKLEIKEIIEILFENRGLKTEKEIEEFLAPTDPFTLKPKDFGINEKEVNKAVKRIREAIKKKEGIIVYGDYDADGICATAILWETLYRQTSNVLPYIPERVGEGYGLNNASISRLKTQNPNLGLIITVDHGITAAEKIKFAKSLGIEVIVCDHHQFGEVKPDAIAIIHTDKVSAGAISWLLAKELETSRTLTENDLDLVAISTIADLEPLLGLNRSLVKFGLKTLNETKRCGLLAVCEEAGIEKGKIGTYEVGFIIAPRINAMGRMEHALESLRLICTPKAQQAKTLASKLGTTNKERQLLTEETVNHARESVLKTNGKNLKKLLFIAHDSYQEGVIGLAAGKLAEEFYRPAVVVARGEKYSKASARSITGFNIIEAIRKFSDLLIEAGGHPMAAGFTIETEKLPLLKSKLEALAEKELDKDKLTKTLKIDCLLPIELVTEDLFQKTRQLEPFGMGNPEPVFYSENLVILESRTVGSTSRHLKLKLKDPKTGFTIEAIGFGFGSLSSKLSFENPIDVAYNLQLNQWNGNRRLEIKIKDLKWKKD